MIKLATCVVCFFLMKLVLGLIWICCCLVFLESKLLLWLAGPVIRFFNERTKKILQGLQLCTFAVTFECSQLMVNLWRVFKFFETRASKLLTTSVVSPSRSITNGSPFGYWVVKIIRWDENFTNSKMVLRLELFLWFVSKTGLKSFCKKNTWNIDTIFGKESSVEGKFWDDVTLAATGT